MKRGMQKILNNFQKNRLLRFHKQIQLKTKLQYSINDVIVLNIGSEQSRNLHS